MDKLLSAIKATSVLPFQAAQLAYQHWAGHESRSSVLQRLGIAYDASRRPGPYIWFHASTIDECAVALPVLFRCMLEYNDKVGVMLTTASLEAYKMLRNSLPERVVVQLMPLNNTLCVTMFMRRWKPTVGILVESPFLPQLVLLAAQHGVKLALINAHMDPEELMAWHNKRHLRKQLEEVLQHFTLIVPQSDVDVGRFRICGATMKQMPGWCNELKYAALMGGSVWHLWQPEGQAMKQLRKVLSNRPNWLAANTVAGEEEIIAQLHQSLAVSLPGLLTVLVPQDSGRCPDVAGMLISRFGLRVGTWSSQTSPAHNFQKLDILLVDDARQLPLLYRLSEVTFMGNSLLDTCSGHSLAQAAVAGSALLIGPHAGSSLNMAEELNNAALLAAEDAAAAVRSTGHVMDDGPAQTPEPAASSSQLANHVARDTTASEGVRHHAVADEPSTAPSPLARFIAQHTTTRPSTAPAAAAAGLTMRFSQFTQYTDTNSECSDDAEDFPPVAAMQYCYGSPRHAAGFRTRLSTQPSGAAPEYMDEDTILSHNSLRWASATSTSTLQNSANANAAGNTRMHHLRTHVSAHPGLHAHTLLTATREELFSRPSCPASAISDATNTRQQPGDTQQHWLLPQLAVNETGCCTVEESGGSASQGAGSPPGGGASGASFAGSLHTAGSFPASPLARTSSEACLEGSAARRWDRMFGTGTQDVMPWCHTAPNHTRPGSSRLSLSERRNSVPHRAIRATTSTVLSQRTPRHPPGNRSIASTSAPPSPIPTIKQDASTQTEISGIQQVAAASNDMLQNPMSVMIAAMMGAMNGVRLASHQPNSHLAGARESRFAGAHGLPEHVRNQLSHPATFQPALRQMRTLEASLSGLPNRPLGLTSSSSGGSRIFTSAVSSPVVGVVNRPGEGLDSNHVEASQKRMSVNVPANGATGSDPTKDSLYPEAPQTAPAGLAAFNTTHGAFGTATAFEAEDITSGKRHDSQDRHPAANASVNCFNPEAKAGEYAMWLAAQANDSEADTNNGDSPASCTSARLMPRGSFEFGYTEATSPYGSLGLVNGMRPSIGSMRGPSRLGSGNSRPSLEANRPASTTEAAAAATEQQDGKKAAGTDANGLNALPIAPRPLDPHKTRHLQDEEVAVESPTIIPAVKLAKTAASDDASIQSNASNFPAKDERHAATEQASSGKDKDAQNGIADVKGGSVSGAAALLLATEGKGNSIISTDANAAASLVGKELTIHAPSPSHALHARTSLQYRSDPGSPSCSQPNSAQRSASESGSPTNGVRVSVSGWMPEHAGVHSRNSRSPPRSPNGAIRTSKPPGLPRPPAARGLESSHSYGANGVPLPPGTQQLSPHHSMQQLSNHAQQPRSGNTLADILAMPPAGSRTASQDSINHVPVDFMPLLLPPATNEPRPPSISSPQLGDLQVNFAAEPIQPPRFASRLPSAAGSSSHPHATSHVSASIPPQLLMADQDRKVAGGSSSGIQHSNGGSMSRNSSFSSTGGENNGTLRSVRTPRATAESAGVPPSPRAASGLTPRASALAPNYGHSLSPALSGYSMSIPELQALAAATSVSPADAVAGPEDHPETPTSRLSIMQGAASPFAGGVFDRPDPFAGSMFDAVGPPTTYLIDRPNSLSGSGTDRPDPFRAAFNAGAASESDIQAAVALASQPYEPMSDAVLSNADSTPPTPTSRLSAMASATSPFATSMYDRPNPFTGGFDSAGKTPRASQSIGGLSDTAAQQQAYRRSGSAGENGLSTTRQQPAFSEPSGVRLSPNSAHLRRGLSQPLTTVVEERNSQEDDASLYPGSTIASSSQGVNSKQPSLGTAQASDDRSTGSETPRRLNRFHSHIPGAELSPRALLAMIDPAAAAALPAETTDEQPETPRIGIRASANPSPIKSPVPSSPFRPSAPQLLHFDSSESPNLFAGQVNPVLNDQWPTPALPQAPSRQLSSSFDTPDTKRTNTEPLTPRASATTGFADLLSMPTPPTLAPSKGGLAETKNAQLFQSVVGLATAVENASRPTTARASVAATSANPFANDNTASNDAEGQQENQDDLVFASPATTVELSDAVHQLMSMLSQGNRNNEQSQTPPGTARTLRENNSQAASPSCSESSEFPEARGLSFAKFIRPIDSPTSTSASGTLESPTFGEASFAVNLKTGAGLGAFGMHRLASMQRAIAKEFGSASSTPSASQGNPNESPRGDVMIFDTEEPPQGSAPLVLPGSNGPLMVAAPRDLVTHLSLQLSEALDSPMTVSSLSGSPSRTARPKQDEMAFSSDSSMTLTRLRLPPLNGQGLGYPSTARCDPGTRTIKALSVPGTAPAAVASHQQPSLLIPHAVQPSQPTITSNLAAAFDNTEGAERSGLKPLNTKSASTSSINEPAKEAANNPASGCSSEVSTATAIAADHAMDASNAPGNPELDETFVLPPPQTAVAQLQTGPVNVSDSQPTSESNSVPNQQACNTAAELDQAALADGRVMEAASQKAQEPNPFASSSIPQKSGPGPAAGPSQPTSTAQRIASPTTTQQQQAMLVSETLPERRSAPQAQQQPHRSSSGGSRQLNSSVSAEPQLQPPQPTTRPVHEGRGFVLPATQLSRATGPAVWAVGNETELHTALLTLLQDPLERRSRGYAAAQAAAKLASGLVNTVWHVLDDSVITPALHVYVNAHAPPEDQQATQQPVA